MTALFLLYGGIMRNINILGTVYTIEYKGYDEDTKFKDNGWAAYICERTKKIVIGRE